MTLAQERDVWSEYQHATGVDRERIEEELVREHQHLARFVSRKYYSSQHEPEDIFQTAFLGLLKAVRGFKSELGMQFSTYAVKTMRRDIGHLIRDQFAEKREGEMDTISIHLPLNNDGERIITILDSVVDEGESPAEEAEVRAMAKAIMEKAGEFLSGNELKAFVLKYSTDDEPSSYQIGKQLNLSGTQVRRLCENAEFKMRAYFKSGALPEKEIAQRKPWTQSETQFLRRMLASGKRRKEIIQQFRYRTEKSVDTKILSVRKQLKEEGLL